MREIVMWRNWFSVLDCFLTGLLCIKQCWWIITLIFKLCYALDLMGLVQREIQGIFMLWQTCSLVMVVADFRDHLFSVKRKKNIYNVFKWLCWCSILTIITTRFWREIEHLQTVITNLNPVITANVLHYTCNWQ